jgi:hypothetical protein
MGCFFQLVSVNPHKFRKITCTVIKLLFKCVVSFLGNQFEEIFPGRVEILWFVICWTFDGADLNRKKKLPAQELLVLQYIHARNTST